jgi:hypothetical protein
MNTSSYQKISLPEVLDILQGQDSSSPNIFVNPSGALETFFTYKGTLVELHKYSIAIQLGKSTKEKVGEEIRSILINGLQKGYWIVFFVGSSSSFDFSEFFSQFDFNKGDKNIFNSEKLHDKSYLLSSGILRKEDDQDVFGNQGGYSIAPDSRVVYLTTCDEADLSKLREVNKNIQFNYVLVQ